jgi:hypothetical protein
MHYNVKNPVEAISAKNIKPLKVKLSEMMTNFPSYQHGNTKERISSLSFTKNLLFTTK